MITSKTTKKKVLRALAAGDHDAFVDRLTEHVLTVLRERQLAKEERDEQVHRDALNAAFDDYGSG